MSKDEVTHRGRIVKIDDNAVTLDIGSCRTECSGCSIKTVCTGTDSVGRIVVSVDGSVSELHPGDRVEAQVSEQTRHAAILTLTVLPMVVMTVVQLVMDARSLPVWLSVFASITAAILTFAALSRYFRRHPGKIVWKVTKV